MKNRFLLLLPSICVLLLASCVKEPQPIRVTGITLNATSLSLVEGETSDLVATVSPKDADNQAIIWSSTYGSVASVNNGKVTALKAGSTEITAKSDDGGFTAKCVVTVAPKTIEVSSISLSKTELSLTEGDSETITASVKPDNATDKTVIWSSSDASIATVKDGVVTAIKEGVTTITASAGSKTATCAVTVKAKVIDVTSVTLDKTSASLKAGETVTLTATVKPDDATDKTVTWTTSDDSVATVKDGVVTAVKVGSATITAKAGDKSATCAVTVVATPVTSVTLDKTSMTMTEGETQTLTATVSPSNATDKSVTWFSNNTSIATVSSSGLVTAKASGTAIITVATNDGDKKATCSITIIQSGNHEAVDLGLSVKWATCNVGASTPEEYGNYYAWGETILRSEYTWETYKWCNGSYNTLTKYNTKKDYGTVDNKTQLDLSDDAAHANWGGKWRIPTDAECTELRDNCTWTWTTQNGVSGYRVTSKKNGNSIFLPAAGNRNDTSLNDAGSWGCYWSSTIMGSPKDALVMCFWLSISLSRNYFERRSGLSVRPVYGEPTGFVTGVSLDKTYMYMTIGDTQTLTATVKPSNAPNKSVTWSSSNTSVATVSSSGVITAKTAGSATITVTTNDGGKKATCSVKVSQNETVDLGLSVKWATCNVGASKPEGYGAFFAWGETSPKSDYSWGTYKWYDSFYGGLTKYNTETDYGTVDNKTQLDLSDDVAHANWGGKWRIPTDLEWCELYDNCLWEWTSQNGVSGYRVTSKKNGNSIFLPVGGYRGGTSLYDSRSYGYYWSSTLSTDKPNKVYYVYFRTDFVIRGTVVRTVGQPVRPVSD